MEWGFLGEVKTEGSGRVSHNKRVNCFGFPLPPLLYTFEPLWTFASKQGRSLRMVVKDDLQAINCFTKHVQKARLTPNLPSDSRHLESIHSSVLQSTFFYSNHKHKHQTQIPRWPPPRRPLLPPRRLLLILLSWLWSRWISFFILICLLFGCRRREMGLNMTRLWFLLRLEIFQNWSRGGCYPSQHLRQIWNA